MIDWTTYSDEELRDEQMAIDAEITRRFNLETIPQQMADLNVQYLDVAGVVEGEPWVQPMGAHDAYPKDWIVTHNDSTWLSLLDANVWEPGVSGWAVGDGGEWPAWTQPTGAHDDYAAGAKVSHLELHWISDADGNVWEPGVYGWTEADE
jgi:hypothetical protein